MIKNPSFLLLTLLCTGATSSTNTVVSCVSSKTDSPVLVAKALADAEYLSNNSPAVIEQVTEVSVKSSGGVEHSRFTHDATVSHSGKVRSEIIRKWIDSGETCVELVFKKPLT
jgi:hypothetical protein